MKFREGVSGLSPFASASLLAISVSSVSRRRGLGLVSRSQSFDIPLNDQDFFLFEVVLQFFLELAEKTPGGPLVRRDDTEDDDLVAVGDVSHSPVALVRLWEERNAIELIE